MKLFISSVSNYFISLTVKLFLDTVFINLSVIFVLLIFNVIINLARYNYLLDSNQAVLIILNRFLFI